MVGVEFVAEPRVEGGEDVRFEATDLASDVFAELFAGGEGEVRIVEPDGLTDSEGGIGVGLFLFSEGGKLCGDDVRGVRADGAVCADYVVDRCSFGNPEGDSAAAVEIGIVGMGRDDENSLVFHRDKDLAIIEVRRSADARDNKDI